MCVYICVYVYAHKYSCSLRPEALDPTRTAVTGTCKTPNMDAGSQTQVLYKYMLLTTEIPLQPFQPCFEAEELIMEKKVIDVPLSLTG